MSSSRKKILIIDDHLLFADGLKLLLIQLGNVEISAVSDVQEVLCNTQNFRSFALIVIDLHMPGTDGFSFLNALKKQKLALRVVVISGTENQSEIEEAIALGAIGYIPKDSSTDEMLQAVLLARL